MVFPLLFLNFFLQLLLLNKMVTIPDVYFNIFLRNFTVNVIELSSWNVFDPDKGLPTTIYRRGFGDPLPLCRTLLRPLKTETAPDTQVGRE